MKQLLAAALLSCAGTPASATEWVLCAGGDGKVNFDVLLGSMAAITIDTLNIEASGKRWSTKPAAGVTKISTGQAFETADQMLIDMTEAGTSTIIAKLRLFKASDDSEGIEATDATAGVLHLPGVGVWAVSCSGP